MRDDDWQRVVDAFRQGQVQDHFASVTTRYGPKEADAKRVKELSVLKKALDDCSEATLTLLETYVLGPHDALPMKGRGEITFWVDHLLGFFGQRPSEKVGRRPVPTSYMTAIAVLSALYAGDHPKVRGAKANVTKSRKGNYAFNPYITWLGKQLMRVEDEVLPQGERRMSLNEACLVAWNATPTNQQDNA